MKKKNMVLFIDGENIPAKESQKIFTAIQGIGELDFAKVYGIQNDMGTRAWSRKATEIDGLNDIRLYGGPGKDKVDRKIQKDISRDLMRHKNIDIVVIATSDHGYSSSVREMRAKGKKVIVIGNEKSAKSLKAACNLHIVI